jgi:Na+-transporting NADH:ubiquinone oxidoreductase subunit A
LRIKGLPPKYSLLALTVPTKPLELARTDIQTRITDQSALIARAEDDFRIDLLVAEGDRVGQGAPVLRSRRDTELTFVAPVAGQVASIELGPGRRLSHILFFHMPGGERHEHNVGAWRGGEDAAATRALLLSGGLWPRLRSRPFGRVPPSSERPSALFVMALDTRPDAAPPALALQGREEEFSRGLRALTGLADGPVVVCHNDTVPKPMSGLGDRVIWRKISPVHPHGLAGIQIAALHPARPNQPVWDMYAEDVVDIGEFLATGFVPETRLVSVSGTALREDRLMRCQPGADLRALCFDIVKPGPHRLLAGSPLDGVESRWLGTRSRQVTALSGAAPEVKQHWFSAALRSAGRPLPIIPTAALEQAFGGLLPSAALVRAIASNDTETATRLGALSLLEDDVALADYVTTATPSIAIMLRAMLDRIAAEELR